MARPFSSWLSGPAQAEPAGADRYPGRTLGLPETGPRSLARTARRAAALLVDWLACYGLAALLMTFGLFSEALLSTAVLAIWFVLGASRCGCSAFLPDSWRWA